MAYSDVKKMSANQLTGNLSYWIGFISALVLEEPEEAKRRMHEKSADGVDPHARALELLQEVAERLTKAQIIIGFKEGKLMD